MEKNQSFKGVFHSIDLKVDEQVEEVLNIIAMERTKQGFNAGQMADFIGMSLSGYRKFETGNTEATISKVCQCAEVLKIKLNVLFGFGDSTLPDYEPIVKQMQETIKEKNAHLSLCNEKMMRLEKQVSELQNA